MIRLSFNIGCSESKVIFKWRKTKPHKSKKGFREANVHTLCISFTLSQTLSGTNKQTVEHSQHTEKPALSLR